MLGLWVLQIRLFYLPKVIHYVRDGRTDGRTEATLNAPFLTRVGIIMSLKTIAVTVYSGNVIHFMCLAKSCYLLYVYCCIVITDNSLSISRTSYRPTETFHMPTFRCVRLVSQHADDSWLKSSEDGCTRVRRWLHSSPKMGIHKSENRLLESEDGCTRDRARSQTTRRLRTL